MAHAPLRRWISMLVILQVTAAVAAAQPAGDRDALLQSRWPAILAEVLQARGLAIVDANARPVAANVPGARVSGEPAAVQAAYREAIVRLVTDAAMQPFFTPDPQTATVVRPSDAEWITRLAESGVADKGAKSVNAAATNPAAPQIAERSGFTDLVALALDMRDVFAADKSAVSLNLNALALVGLTSETESAPALYRRYDGLRRIGGTFTFGAQIPEGEITGLTGLPSAGDLLDAIAWDVRFRVIGDRDPRARRWDDLMLGVMGGVVQMSAVLLGLVPQQDLLVVRKILEDNLGIAVAAAKHRISHSLQVTVKGAGQHLRDEDGKDKYSVGLLADKGFGNTDLTANLLYSTLDDATVVPGASVQLDTLTVSAGINHLTARDALVKGRSIELSANLNFDFALEDEAALPTPREHVWRVVGAIAIPWGSSAKIPVSVTYTNDKNRLANEKFVTGFVGISYDFGALKSLFAPAVAN